jgi:hypothetical protein
MRSARSHPARNPPPHQQHAPPESQAPASTPAPFILGARPDLALMVAAPTWILPLVLAGAVLAGDRAINEGVAALGAVGHHLPGMMRAYGDRALFRRFRARFILAPLTLAGVCVAVAQRGLHAIVFVAFVWGIWHALAQTYGFARIYGAKAGAGDRASALCDRALLVAWFTTAVVWSPLRLFYLLDLAATCGLPLPPAGAVAFLRSALAAATGAVTLAWLVLAGRRLRDGRSVGRVRVLLLVTSIAFWWFANVRVRHLLLAAPLFEVFHDVQYLTIVWVYNRRRIEQAGGDISPSLRALFRPTLAAVAVYVLAVMAYGSIQLYPPHWPQGSTILGLVAASQLLHFYYDGFIWKVREGKTGAVLGLRSGAAGATAGGQLSSRPAVRHALLWGLLLVPCGVLWHGETAAPMAPAERAVAVAALVPDNTLGRFNAAELHWQAGDRQAALDGFRAVLKLDPSSAAARRNLAFSLCTLGDEALDAGQPARLAPLVEELSRLSPGLTAEDARFVDERVASFRALSGGR